ncbi:MAG: hypothetical protein WB784_09725 [Rhodanobacteraceae bacterium]
MNLNMQLIRGCAALLVIIALAAAAVLAPAAIRPCSQPVLTQQPLKAAGADRASERRIEASRLSAAQACPLCSSLAITIEHSRGVRSTAVEATFGSARLNASL